MIAGQETLPFGNPLAPCRCSSADGVCGRSTLPSSTDLSFLLRVALSGRTATSYRNGCLWKQRRLTRCQANPFRRMATVLCTPA